MTTHPHPDHHDAEGVPVDREHLVPLVVFEYRSTVLRRLAVTTEWSILEWTETAACHTSVTVTHTVCERCEVVPQCLAAALTSDDPAPWRGGLNRADRQQLWAGLERTYRDVRDFELIRLTTAPHSKQQHAVMAGPNVSGGGQS